jgi:hypothetical protein
MGNFCTVTDVATLLQLTIAADNAAVLRAIEEASAAIRNYCHQEIELVEDEEITLDCNGGTRLFLPELPVTEVAAVVEDDEALVATTDYKLGQHGILHRVGRCWATGVQIITVTYSHGYTTIPDDVAAVCARAAARVYQAGLRAAEDEGVPGVASKALGDFSVSFASDAGGGVSEGVMGASSARMLLMSEKDVLNRYRYVRL